MDRDGGKVYLAIDLKSFYASVECVERHLNPLDTNLVVADTSRSEKTICLAVSPSLKAQGVPGRPRLFEVIQKVRGINYERFMKNGQQPFVSRSVIASELAAHPELELGYIAAMPQMALYLKYSADIYNIYLKYVAPEDIVAYSIDEVFMDVTGYLKTYNLSARELAVKIVRDIVLTTGITATAGIGTNLYLAKIAMDVIAKHAEPDEYGARLGELDEFSYRRQLWDYEPITDFWRVGPGYANRLYAVGLRTMGDIARCSLGSPVDPYNEELLFKLFGINAELLIDHAWGIETATMADIKNLRPVRKSLGQGQVLKCPYKFEQGRTVLSEMTEQLALDLVSHALLCQKLVITVCYDNENLATPQSRMAYKGPMVIDHFERVAPKPAHGTCTLKRFTSAASLMVKAAQEFYDKNVNPKFTVRRINIAATALISEREYAALPKAPVQTDLFTDYEALNKERQEEDRALERERRKQQAMLAIKAKFGKNAILTGTNFEDGATGRERNSQIGGHKA